jgi:hypothetical protein
MADTAIPADLLAAQRAFDTAHAALMSAPEDLPDVDRQGLRVAEREAALALQAARAGTPWASVAGQKELWAAARGEE